VKGAFTGPRGSPGLFEQADGAPCCWMRSESAAALQANCCGSCRRARSAGGRPENARVDVRLLAATPRILREAAAGRFATICSTVERRGIHLQPLSERRATSHPWRAFCGAARRPLGRGCVERSGARVASEQPWPGNVRSLETPSNARQCCRIRRSWSRETSAPLPLPAPRRGGQG